MTDTYKIEPNHCNCHPETCNCAPWVLTKSGEKIAEVYNRELLEQVLERLRELEKAKQYLHDILAHTRISHCDMGGNHTYAFKVTAYPIISEALNFLAQEQEEN